MTFNANEHLINTGNKGEYLEVKWRIVWFREQQAKVGIHTELLFLEPTVVFKATVISEDGIVLATGHGSAPLAGSKVWTGKGIEKAETAAIGRALAHAGYGTQFAPEDDEEPDTVVDSPVQPKNTPKTAAPEPTAAKPAQNGGNVTLDWFTKPVGETWKDLHPYLLEHIYKGNKIGKEKSLAHHAKLNNQWVGMTAGDVVKYLETRHEDAS